jgi:hypothetical protein
MTTTIPLHDGGRLDILDPRACEFRIETIARGLSREPRWAGQTNTHFALSTAEHCVRVAALLPPGTKRKAGLLHDGHEGIGYRDVAKPFKPVLRSYEEQELFGMHAMFDAYGLDWPLDPDVKRVDELMAAWEARDYFTPSYVFDAALVATLPAERLPEPMDEHAAYRAFMAAYEDIFGAGE